MNFLACSRELSTFPIKSMRTVRSIVVRSFQSNQWEPLNKILQILYRVPFIFFITKNIIQSIFYIFSINFFHISFTNKDKIVEYYSLIIHDSATSYLPRTSYIHGLYIVYTRLSFLPLTQCNSLCLRILAEISSFFMYIFISS